MKMVPMSHLNTWSLVDETIWQGLGGVGLLELCVCECVCVYTHTYMYI